MKKTVGQSATKRQLVRAWRETRLLQ